MNRGRVYRRDVRSDLGEPYRLFPAPVVILSPDSMASNLNTSNLIDELVRKTPRKAEVTNSAVRLLTPLSVIHRCFPVIITITPRGRKGDLWISSAICFVSLSWICN